MERTPTYAERLLRYLVEYADFCRLIQQGAVVILVIFGVTEPIFVNFAQDVAKILPLNIFLIGTAIFQSIRFGTSVCRIKVILPISPKIGCHGNVP